MLRACFVGLVFLTFLQKLKLGTWKEQDEMDLLTYLTDTSYRYFWSQKSRGWPVGRVLLMARLVAFAKSNPTQYTQQAVMDHHLFSLSPSTIQTVPRGFPLLHPLHYHCDGLDAHFDASPPRLSVVNGYLPPPASTLPTLVLFFPCF
ncbi:hypothetical protein CPAR01_03741 [Colletotrichum paranaense]|uniref:Secreted protein n=1 Tax=Colletotrichum paranaense TaxID=1914294 RepID=A0ABQ9SUB0_9PEZI|nr:uncharacterized protein CPAR01_03741 [Colletotrichum paranaense]KAK1543108.1 hypothetical protein CPAR01_03741 [Colletotrichum paranaense]